MKSLKATYALIAISAVFVGSGLSVQAAETVAGEKAKPGTSQETDSKSQENNPSGPADQSAAATSPDSKQSESGEKAKNPEKKTSLACSTKKHHKKHHSSTKKPAGTTTPATVK